MTFHAGKRDRVALGRRGPRCTGRAWDGTGKLAVELIERDHVRASATCEKPENRYVIRCRWSFLDKEPCSAGWRVTLWTAASASPPLLLRSLHNLRDLRSASTRRRLHGCELGKRLVALVGARQVPGQVDPVAGRHLGSEVPGQRRNAITLGFRHGRLGLGRQNVFDAPQLGADRHKVDLARIRDGARIRGELVPRAHEGLAHGVDRPGRHVAEQGDMRLHQRLAGLALDGDLALDRAEHANGAQDLGGVRGLKIGGEFVSAPLESDPIGLREGAEQRIPITTQGFEPGA